MGRGGLKSGKGKILWYPSNCERHSRIVMIEVAEMKAIVNVNQSWGIGKDGGLLAYIPEDMKLFRNATKGGTVIMGRKTLESFPGGKPLKGRLNIVLTRDADKLRRSMERQREADGREAGTGLSGVQPKDVDIPQVLELDCEGTRFLALNSTKALLGMDAALLRDAFVIGGAQIYRELLPYCDECLVTVNDSPREADTFFPDLDAPSDWKRVQESEEKTYEDIHYKFTVYRRTAE